VLGTWHLMAWWLGGLVASCLAHIRITQILVRLTTHLAPNFSDPGDSERIYIDYYLVFLSTCFI